MKLKIKASAVKMPCDQWADFLIMDGEYLTLLHGEVIWRVLPDDVIGLQLDPDNCLGFRVYSIGNIKSWSKTT